MWSGIECTVTEIRFLTRHRRALAIGAATFLLAAAPASPPVELQRPHTTDTEYPLSALLQREQGTVRYRHAIAADGRVTACTITSSSGSATLDAATCRVMLTRARFRPAHDANGNPVTATYEGHLRWVIP